MKKTILVPLSGGLDSFTCLLHAPTYCKDGEILPVFIEYGQNCSKVERQCAENICARLGYNLLQLSLDLSGVAPITSGNTVINSGFNLPNRNILLMSYAVAKTYPDIIIIGSNKNDVSHGDSTRQFWDSFSYCIESGSNKPFEVMLPLIDMYKSEIPLFLFDYYGRAISDFALTETTSCYNTVQKNHVWGVGCGVCENCATRKEVYKQYLLYVKDK